MLRFVQIVSLFFCQNAVYVNELTETLKTTENINDELVSYKGTV